MPGSVTEIQTPSRIAATRGVALAAPATHDSLGIYVKKRWRIDVLKACDAVFWLFVTRL